MAADLGLLIGQTRQKVTKAIRTIESVSGQGFPYRHHARDVLDFIKEELKDLEEDLSDLDASNNSPDAIQTLCQEALRRIFEVLPILGLCIRSINVSGPVELHGPLLRLTHKAIGEGAKLVISSEWDFSPYTVIYPALLHNQFVLVALPVSEAENALISPLAAHELGHNIWENNGYRRHFEERVEDQLVEVLRGPMWAEYDAYFEVADSALVDKTLAREHCDASWVWGASQCEEVFCDMMGLLIFREAYLYAFEYLLAPGTGDERVKRYPSMKERIGILSTISKKEKIPVPADFVDRFLDEDLEDDDRTKFLLAVADKITASLIDEIYVAAREFVADKKLSAYSEKEIAVVLEALKRAVPAINVNGIENIVNAGWRIQLREVDYWAARYPRTKGQPDEQARILNELLLKSLEVFEIEQLQMEP